MSPLRRKTDTSKLTYFILAWMLSNTVSTGCCSESDVNPKMRKKSQSFLTTTNMSMLWEVVIMYLLRMSQRQRRCCRWRWPVWPLNTSKQMDGGCFSLTNWWPTSFQIYIYIFFYFFVTPCGCVNCFNAPLRLLVVLLHFIRIISLGTVFQDKNSLYAMTLLNNHSRFLYLTNTCKDLSSVKQLSPQT